MMRPDGALARAQAPNPYRRQRGAQLLWGKVSGRHPQDGTVDVTLDHGSILPHVPVLPQLVGTLTGASYLPATDPVQPQPTPQGPYGLPTPNPDPAANEYYAVVAWLEGSGREPMVIGFLPPSVPQAAWLPQQPGWAVRRHESGQWEAVDPQGNWTLGWPDGSTLTVTTASTAPDPVTAINPAWPASSGAPVAVHLRLSSGATVDLVDTTLTINGGTAAVARAGDPVAVTINGTTYSGTITSGSTHVFID